MTKDADDYDDGGGGGGGGGEMVTLAIMKKINN